MARGALPVAVWGAGSPVATAIAEGLRQHGFEATAIAGLRRRPGGVHRSIVFPVWDGGTPEDPGHWRARLLADAATLLAALDAGLERLIVISCAAAYGDPGEGAPIAESAPLTVTDSDTFAADAAAVEALLGTAGARPGPGRHPNLTVLRPAHLLGAGCETSLLARHLAGPRLMVVRGTAPRWQICHIHDLTAALAFVLGADAAPLRQPAVVASSGVLDQSALELASGRRRLELPAMVAEATAARLRRTRLSPAAPDELPLLTRPAVVEPALLTGLGFVPGYDAAGAVRAHLRETTPGGRPDAAADPDSALPSGQQAATLAGATVAVVGSAALLRRARRRRGLRSG